MKIAHIFFLIIIIGYISCASVIQDISLSTDYDIDTSEFPKGIIPNDTILYFRLEITDDINKNIQIISNKTLTKDSFIVKIGYFEEKPDDTALEKEEEWETAEYKEISLDSNKNISTYSAKFKENTTFILISVQLKSDFETLSIKVKNPDEEKKKTLVYQVKYSPDHLTQYKINLTEFDIKKDTIALRVMEEHVGEVFLNFVIKHDVEDLKLNIKAISLKTNKEEDLEKELKSENPNYIDIVLNEKVKEDDKDAYAYRFTLDENRKYAYIFFQLNMELEELTLYLDYMGGEEEVKHPLYNITKSKTINIDLKKLNESKSEYFTLKSTNRNDGNMLLKLIVKHNIPKDVFFLEGFGNKEYVPLTYEGNSTNLSIEFNGTVQDEKEKKDIHQYYFKEDNSIPFFTINVFVKKNIDYLSVKLEKIVTLRERFEPIVVALIVFAILIVLFIILFLICRKCKVLDVVTSKEIEKGSPIEPE